MNTLGERFRLTTFGESHGVGIGGVIDGLPSGLEIDTHFIEQEMQRRQGGRSIYATPRKEADRVEILSGVFEGVSTGTPLAFIIWNEKSKSADYENIKNLLRPGHADFTYFYKYGIRDYRGGGRASARETAARVAAGAIAKLLLRHFSIEVRSGILSVGEIVGSSVDYKYARESEIFALDKDCENLQKEAIDSARKNHNSIGGVALLSATGVPCGLGEPLYYKLDSALSAALMGLNGVKAVEIGLGCEASRTYGSINNDPISPSGFLSNNAGGILGGISNGEEIVLKIYFKPTPSIFIPQQTIDTHNQPTTCCIKGRHDPCIAIRGSVVCESLASLVLADMLLLNATTKLENLKKIYS